MIGARRRVGIGRAAQWRRNRRIVSFVPKASFCTVIKYIINVFPHIIWPEGCLIALITEEKDDSHCQDEESDMKLSQGRTVSQPLSSIFNQSHINPITSSQFFTQRCHHFGALLVDSGSTGCHTGWCPKRVQTDGEQNANASITNRNEPLRWCTQIGAQMVQINGRANSQTLHKTPPVQLLWHCQAICNCTVLLK